MAKRKKYYGSEMGNIAFSSVNHGLVSLEAIKNTLLEIDHNSPDGLRDKLELDQMLSDDLNKARLGFELMQDVVRALVGELFIAVNCLDELNKEYHDGSYSIDFRVYQTVQDILSDDDGWFVVDCDDFSSEGENDIPFEVE